MVKIWFKVAYNRPYWIQVQLGFVITYQIYPVLDSSKLCLVWSFFCIDYMQWICDFRPGMAASKSCHPHEASPSSPETYIKPSTKKGKQKKENVQCINSRKWQAPASSACRKSGISWDWTTLTDPSASRTPPIYTKDGRHVSICLFSLHVTEKPVRLVIFFHS